MATTNSKVKSDLQSIVI